MKKNTDIILHAKKIKKAFYNPVHIKILDDVELTVRRGETVAIMGRSGEGKSTLLQVLGTLDTPCSGELIIDDINVTAFNKSHIRNQKLGFIFQSFHLLDDYSALENVLMPARIARKNVSKGSVAYTRACDLLIEVGLGDRINFNTKLLSGGEKQRAAIARSLFNNPDIILADEPSGNLDKETARQIHHLLMNFANTQGKALIIVTHDPELAQLCNTRYRLQDKQLVLQTLCDLFL